MSLGDRLSYPFIDEPFVDENKNLTPANARWLNEIIYVLNEYIKGGLDTQGISATNQKTIDFFRASRMTTEQRDSVIPEIGLIIYNTTLNKYQGYTNIGWVDFH